MANPASTIGSGSSWNPQAASTYLRDYDAQEHAELTDPDVTVRIFDKMFDLHDYAQDYIELEFEVKRNEAGGLSMTLPGDSTVREHIFDNPDGPDAIIPIVVDTTGHQWSGQIDTAAIVLDEDGVETIEITALHDWEWCNRIAMWPSPFAPLEVQFPKRMIGIGPAETIIKTFYKANLIRLQAPIWRMPSLGEIFHTGPLDILSTIIGGPIRAIGEVIGWFIPGLAPRQPVRPQGGEELDAASMVGKVFGRENDPNFPVCVMPPRYLKDTTKWCAVSARMQTGSELFEQVLKDSGLTLTAKVWIPEEHGQPHPTINLTRPTIVLDVEDHTGVTGPTGTVLDGMLWWATELLDDTVTEVLSLSTEKDGDLVMDDDLGQISKWLGMRKARPDVVWIDGQYSGIISGQVTVHKPMARDIIVGGKSPGWVNSLIDIGMSLLLNYIGLAIGAPGIASLYTGQFDDILLAYQRFTDAGRARRAGPYLYHEHVVADSSSAYTIDSTMSGRSGMFDTRGYTSKVIKVRDAAPYVFGRDYDIGHLVGYELNQIIWTDYVSSAVFRDSREERASWEITIGDGSDEEDGATRAQRKIGSLFSLIKDVGTDIGAGDLGLGIL